MTFTKKRSSRHLTGPLTPTRSLLCSYSSFEPPFSRRGNLTPRDHPALVGSRAPAATIESQ